ncbi:MAG: hypothetical protein ACRENE_21665 [Polyangiaceae bacterium]
MAASLCSSTGARADGLTSGETARLFRGGAVVRTAQVERWGRRYVGGMSYAVVDARARDVSALIDDVGTWQKILPKTRSARVIGFAGDDPLVSVTHGTAFVQATYTIRVHREGSVVRFWLDTSHHHDIEDIWGFLRIEPVAPHGDDAEEGHALVSYGIMVDMGPGLMRDLFESRVRDLALTVPGRVRGLVSDRAAALAAERRASR